MNDYENADMPANPTKLEVKLNAPRGSGYPASKTIECFWLTKREMFAMHAMQGICVNAGRNECSFDDNSIAVIAVQQADALLAELDK